MQGDRERAALKPESTQKLHKAFLHTEEVKTDTTIISTHHLFTAMKQSNKQCGQKITQ